MYLDALADTLVVMFPDDRLRCPHCGGDNLTPDPDPTSLWSCLTCARVFRVVRVGTLPGGWACLRPATTVVSHADVGTAA